MQDNALDDSMQILEDIFIRKTHHTIAARSKERRAYGIAPYVFVCAVLRAVKLDNDLRAMACEVCNVRTNWRLTSEV